MECKKEDEKNLIRFWREFNEAYKAANKTNKIPTNWMGDRYGVSQFQWVTNDMRSRSTQQNQGM